ncbi:hypothetical protein V492_00833 [Pseudogymnoascus sp. VKM F-4246]|nr:hypothetical protein V492_00833 [Pseudogymnoascus sp. VKM F-4246]
MVSGPTKQPAKHTPLPPSNGQVGPVSKTAAAAASALTTLLGPTGDDTVTIQRTYSFAGKVHTETKVVPRDSAEARLYLASNPNQSAPTSASPPRRATKLTRRSMYKPIIDLGAPRSDLKLGSKMDWAGFVDKEGFREGLEVAEKGKGSYLHKKDFLERVEGKREEARRATVGGVRITMAVLKTLLYAALAALAIADSSSFSTHVVHISSLNSTFNTTSPVKTFQGLPVDGNSITLKTKQGEKLDPPLSAQTATIDCLEPLHGLVPDDCASICNNIAEQQGVVVLQPFQLWSVTYGLCVFEVMNTSPCQVVAWDPMSTLSVYCTSMWFECAQNGHDGFVEIGDRPIAMALAGLEAAPPYTADPC